MQFRKKMMLFAIVTQSLSAGVILTNTFLPIAIGRNVARKDLKLRVPTA